MEIALDVKKTFTFSYGINRVGKTVVITILDEDGVELGSGFSIGSVVELGNGVYGVDITFTGKITGYIKANNTSDGFSLFQPIRVIDDIFTTIVTINDKLPPRIKKNTAFDNFMFLMTDIVTHAPKIGLIVQSRRSINGGLFADCDNQASEVERGLYKIDLTADDLNGDAVTLLFTATGADDRIITIVTQE